MQKFAVQIIGWETHQERTNRTNYTWFKFHSKASSGHFWLETSHEEKTVWIYLMCQRNQQEVESLYFSDVVIAAHCQIKPSSVAGIINHFVELGLLRDLSRANTALIPHENQILVSPEEIRREEIRIDNSPLTAAWLAEKWNEICTGYRKVRNPQKLDPKKKKQIKDRLEETPNSEEWVAALTRISLSTKCQGLENEPGKYEHWKATFDWFIKPGRLDQIADGVWDGRKSKPQEQHPFVAIMNAQKGTA
jgi:hypothetical protein